MKRKLTTIVATVFVLILSVSMLTACGGNTLEKYASEHKDFESTLESTLNLKGVDGTVDIKGNDIIITTDITKSISGVEVTDDLKTTLKGSFDQSFDYLADSFASNIKNIEDKTDTKNVKLIVKVNLGDEEIATYEFDDTSKTKAKENKASDNKDEKK